MAFGSLSAPLCLTILTYRSPTRRTIPIAARGLPAPILAFRASAVFDARNAVRDLPGEFVKNPMPPPEVEGPLLPHKAVSPEHGESVHPHVSGPSLSGAYMTGCSEH